MVVRVRGEPEVREVRGRRRAREAHQREHRRGQRHDQRPQREGAAVEAAPGRALHDAPAPRGERDGPEDVRDDRLADVGGGEPRNDAAAVPGVLREDPRGGHVGVDERVGPTRQVARGRREHEALARQEVRDGEHLVAPARGDLQARRAVARGVEAQRRRAVRRVRACGHRAPVGQRRPEGGSRRTMAPGEPPPGTDRGQGSGPAAGGRGLTDGGGAPKPIIA